MYKLLIFFIYVYSVLAINPFFEKGQRAEFFELADDKVITFRIAVSDNELLEIKDKTNLHKDHINYHYDEFLPKFSEQVLAFVKEIEKINFNEWYPGYDFNQILPQLNINDEGIAFINKTEVLSGFHLTKESFNSVDISKIGNMYEYLKERNQTFNINYILSIIQSLKGPDVGRNQATYYYLSSCFDSSIIIYDNSVDFKTKNATMTVELNGEINEFDKVTLKLGGRSSRYYGKSIFNIKIRGKKDLYGRSQFKIRSGARDATFLRQKLACDIHNRLGLPSISTSFISLYINDEYFGFYILSDAFKPSWIESVYKEKDTKSLYQCTGFGNYNSFKYNRRGCKNDNEEITDISEWYQFLDSLDETQSITDLQKIFDVDQFLTEIAIEFLFGSYDHFLNTGNNIYLYKTPDGQWKMYLYDFDSEFGQDIIRYGFYNQYSNIIEDDRFKTTGYNNGLYAVRDESKFDEDFPNYSFGEWANPGHLIKMLIFDDPTYFEEILKDIVTKVFNPATLFPYINKLKQLIAPHIELDKTPNANGQYPGMYDDTVSIYTLAQWDANCEFTTIRSMEKRKAYAIKYWILTKYRYVCRALNMECDPIYMDNNYKYDINHEVEF